MHITRYENRCRITYCHRGLVVWPARFGAETHVGNWELAIWENIKEQAWKLHVQNQHNVQCPQWPFWGFMFGLAFIVSDLACLAKVKENRTATLKFVTFVRVRVTLLHFQASGCPRRRGHALNTRPWFLHALSLLGAGVCVWRRLELFAVRLPSIGGMVQKISIAFSKFRFNVTGELFSSKVNL